MAKPYIFEETGTTITREENGILYLRYAQPGETLEQIRRQAVWVADRVQHVASKEGLISIYADVTALHDINLDEMSKEQYFGIIGAPYVSKVAIVGDAFAYTKLLNMFLIVSKHRGKVKFFFSEIDAKRWLGW